MRRKLLDRKIFGLLVRQAHVVLRTDESLSYLLQVSDGLVDLVDRGLELIAREAVVTTELILELFEVILEVSNIYVLLTNEREFLLVLCGVLRRTAEYADDLQEELRSYDIHLRVAVRHIDDARVVQVTVSFEERYQDRIFTTLLVPVLIELLEEVFVLVLARGSIRLVLHLEHNGYILSAVFVVVTEDEVALAAGLGIIVLLEVGLRESHRTHLGELVHTVLLKRLTDHLRGHTRLQILVVVDLSILVLNSLLVRLLQGLLVKSGLLECEFVLILEFGDLLILLSLVFGGLAALLLDGKFKLGVVLVDLSLELGDLLILLGFKGSYLLVLLSLFLLGLAALIGYGKLELGAVLVDLSLEVSDLLARGRRR